MNDHVRMTTRIPVDLYGAMQQLARQEDRSVNGQLVALLRKALNASPQKVMPATVAAVRASSEVPPNANLKDSNEKG